MIDIYSTTWKTVAAEVQPILDAALKQLEAHGLSTSETEYQRGRVAVARAILALADPDKPTAAPVADTDYGLQGAGVDWAA